MAQIPVSIAVSPSGATLLAAQQVTNTASTVVFNEVVTLGDAGSGNVGSVLASGAQLVEPGGANTQPVTGTVVANGPTAVGGSVVQNPVVAGAVTVGGSVRYIQVDANNYIQVNVTKFTDVNPVPIAGAVTATIAAPFGQAVMASSIPVVLASNQSAGAFPATQTITGTVTLVSDGSLAATAPLQADYAGVRGTTAYPTAVTDGQMIGMMADKAGRAVVVASAPRDLVSTVALSLTATSAIQFIAAGAAGVFQDITTLMMNTAMTSTPGPTVTINDNGTSGTNYIFNLAPNGGLVSNFPVPWKQGTSAASWTAVLSGAGTVQMMAIYIGNK